MKKIWIYAVILALLASNTLAFDLSIKGERISLHAVQEPLRNILQSMVQQGVRVRLDPEVNAIVSATFEDRDIAGVIAAIVKPYDHALVWERTSLTPSSLKLSEVQVYRPGKKEMIQELRPRAFSLVKDQKKSILFVKDVFLLRVRPGTDIDKYLKMFGGSVIDKNKALGIYKVRVPSDSDIPAIVSMINALTRDVQAAPDFAYPVPSVHRADLLLPVSEISGTFRGDGKVPVAVLDSGLMAGVGPDGFVIASLDAVFPSQPISDNVGHGTQMALIASGLVKPLGAETGDAGQVPVVAIRAMDDNGYTSDFTILKSIDYAIEKGARVISISWGSEQQSALMEVILENAASRGMIIVASAGNEPTGKPFYPAAYPSVIGVGAEYPNGKAWEQSNYGSFVQIYAPGFAALPVGYKGAPGIYGGTSISAAYIANLIADYWSKHPGSSIKQIRDAVKDIKLPKQ